MGAAAHPAAMRRLHAQEGLAAAPRSGESVTQVTPRTTRRVQVTHHQGHQAAVSAAAPMCLPIRGGGAASDIADGHGNSKGRSVAAALVVVLTGMH